MTTEESMHEAWLEECRKEVERLREIEERWHHDSIELAGAEVRKDIQRERAEQAEAERDSLENIQVAILAVLHKKHKQIRQLREALPPTEKLRLLADWLDLKDKERSAMGAFISDEVQSDLRAWAGAIEQALAATEASE